MHFEFYFDKIVDSYVTAKLCSQYPRWIYLEHQKAKAVTMSYMCKNNFPLPLYVRLSPKIHSVQQISNVSPTTTLEEKEFINLFRSKELLMFDDKVSSGIW